MVNICRIDSKRSLTENLEEALERVNWRKIVPPNSKVAIKINLCDYVPKSGVTTSQDLLQSMIMLLRNFVQDVKIVESDGLQYSADYAVRATGLLPFIEKTGAEFVNLSRDRFSLIKPRETLYVKKYRMPKTLSDCDVFVTMPVMKTHELTLYTGALKNQFGCYPQHNRVLLHPRLAEAIVDINLILKPKLVVMDAITAIEGNGPAKGFPKKMNLLITSDNVVACDATALQIMNIDVNRVKHVKLAAENNLGPLTGYALTGEKISDVSCDFVLPTKDIGNTFERIVGSNPLTCKLVYDTQFLKPIVKIGRIIRKRTLKGRTYYF
ncbi:DUF362 domain-containing protein [Candidatus Bathyarchaeota archaeon A05DMB-2]|nr:DUF362 domain-containing protein [Candidatus Bathyarchaeota archaeon A05DMB-2]